MEELELPLERLAGLPLQHFQEQRQFGHLYRLGIDVHPVDVG